MLLACLPVSVSSHLTLTRTLGDTGGNQGTETSDGVPQWGPRREVVVLGLQALPSLLLSTVPLHSGAQKLGPLPRVTEGGAQNSGSHLRSNFVTAALAM